MKRCPTCNKTFTDRNLSFCIDDGTPLVDVEDPANETTLVNPSPSSGASGSQSGKVPVYQPPGTYTPAGTPPGQRRKAWPWVLGILALVLLIFVGLGIAAVVFVPRMMNDLVNSNTSGSNSNSSARENSNSNNNTITNTNSSVAENSNLSTNSETPAPTDEVQVLSDLTDLEQEWTVANINADKKKLNRILADDYVGKDVNGNTQGKAEYLNTITRDTTIQDWEFDDLSVTLTGERATLTGIIRLDMAEDRTATFRFTDKFVWRDGRWQATGSEVTPVK